MYKTVKFLAEPQMRLSHTLLCFSFSCPEYVFPPFQFLFIVALLYSAVCLQGEGREKKIERSNENASKLEQLSPSLPERQGDLINSVPARRLNPPHNFNQ